MRTITTLALCFLAAPALAQTQLPHIFQTGQPARADEVNANFGALETAINDNSADIAALSTATSLTWKGAFQSNVIYAVNDLVEYQGSAYLAIAETTGAENPTDSLYWSLFASGGTQGPQGPVPVPARCRVALSHHQGARYRPAVVLCAHLRPAGHRPDAGPSLWHVDH